MATRAHGGTRHLRAALTATLCTALPLSAGAAQSPQLLSKEVVAARVDSMVRAYMAEKGPASVSVAISRGSETLVERAWGVADINTKRPAVAATVYKIGSVSKQFTAVLLLKQVERGKLALTDSIGRYLTTGLRPEWRSLRIEQLLNHTAGMPNDLTREGRPEEEVTTETMIAWAARDTMAFAPGTRMAYSNVGYLLLGALVEKLYGKPYGAALQEEVARPLGLRTLRWCTDPQKDTTVATGHDYQGPGKNQPSAYAHPSKSLGSGGLCASAPDLAAWNRALHGGRVLSPASYTAMITPRGVARGYGFGLQMTTAAWGAPIIYHVGGIIGFSAANAWFPSESLSVATLYNSAGKGLPTNFILEIARAISAPAPQKPPSDAAAPSAPPRPAELSARIDSVVRADILSRGFPSVSISITRGGKVLLERAWGMANVATGQKADASTTYRIASVSKQFTAALVLKLVDRGKLALTDSIGRHLSGLRPEWNAIRIDQLLNHSSGLPRDFLDVKRVREQLSGDALIAMAARDTLVTKPGTAFAYSNTGYMLLGVLVEKLYGKPYGAVLRDEVAKPLGLTTLDQCDDVESGRAAVGYVRSSDGNVGPPNHQHVSQTLGAGGICATAGDLAKWNHALHNGRVVSAASYNAMTTPRGPSKTYGFGLVVRKSSWGSPAITHDGVENGFTIHNGWYPADSLSVTVLYNARPYFDEVLMPDFIGFVALGGSPQPVPPVRAIELPVSATQGEGRPKFVGAYELTIGSVFIVTFEDGNLHVTPPGGGKPQQLFLKSGTSYALGSPESKTTVTFNVDASGVTGFTVRQNGVDRELRKVK